MPGLDHRRVLVGVRGAREVGERALEVTDLEAHDAASVEPLRVVAVDAEEPAVGLLREGPDRVRLVGEAEVLPRLRVTGRRRDGGDSLAEEGHHLGVHRRGVLHHGRRGGISPARLIPARWRG